MLDEISSLIEMTGLNHKGRYLKCLQRIVSTIFLFFFVIGASCFGQSNEAGSAATPIVFNNGNTIDVSSIYPSIHLTSYPVLLSPVEVLGTGGTLTDSPDQAIGFLDPFAGTGTLTLNTGGPYDYIVVAGTNSAYAPPLTIACGLTLQSGYLTFNFGSATFTGPFAVTGNSTLVGNALLFTSNSITGSSAATLNPSHVGGVGDVGAGFIFTGSGPSFSFASSFGGPNTLVLNNTSGTQTFAGAIGGNVYRVGEGGTTNFTAALQANLSVQGGTAILSGANGAVTNPLNSNTAVLLQGGTLTLDNTSANNNSRLSPKFLNFDGGNLSLLGVNNGVTNQYNNFPRGSGQTTGPVFNQGLNVISVQAGSGISSSAIYTFGGLPTSYDGSVDFEGLGANAQVFFNSMSGGPIAPWATYNGTDFATYDTTNGVVALSASGRPSQINAATAGSYVLGTGTQSALTGNISVSGVSMTTGANLDLGGNTLTLNAWLQNGSPSTISDGTLEYTFRSEHDHYFGDIVFTTNADLTISTAVIASSILKNGAGTLTITGSAYGTQGVLSGFPAVYVNQGTLALNVTTPLSHSGVGPITVGEGAGAPGSATLSLLASGQFYSGSNTSQLVLIKLLPAGQFLLNGYNETVGSLEVDSGTVNTGGSTLTANSVTANPVGSAGQIVGGTLNLSSTSPTISVVNAYPDNTYQAATDGLIISSQITSSATLTKTGNGVLVLGGASNSFGNGTVGLIVSQGTVSLQNSGAAGSTNQQIQLANNGQLQGAATATLTLTNPVTAGAASFSGSPLMLSGGLIQSAHGELDVTNTTTIDNYVNNLALSQFAVDGKMGPGTLILSGQASGTATGIFSQDDGVLAFDSDTPLPTGMTLRFVAGTVEAVNNPHTISNPLSIVEDATFAGTEALTFSATTGNTLSATSTRTIYVNDTAPVTINNLNAQQSTLIAGGSGTLVLAGNPTGLLATQITSGTLQIQNPNAPGASLGAVTVSNLGALNLNNYNAIISSLSGNGTVQLGSGSLTTQAGVFSGIINGTGNLIKSWTGMLTLSGANAYSGTTTISSGALQFAKELSLYNNNTSQWNAMNIVVSNGAMLALNVGGSGQFTSGDVSTLLGLGTSNGGFESGSIIGLDTTNAIGGNVTYSGVIANPNSGANALGLTKLGVGTLTLSGANSYSGPTTVSGGVLVIIQNLTSSSLVSIASGAKLNLASGNFAISGTITNNGTLVLGNGVTLSSTGTFTNNGTLDLTNDPSFNLPSNFVNNGTVLTPATDTPTMPPWGLAILGALLLITSAKSLPQRLAASSVEENENG